MARKHGLGLFLAIIFALGGNPAVGDDFTPLIASALNDRTFAFSGSDGKYHVVYELILTNTSPTTAKVNKIEVLSRVAPRSAVATFQGQGLAQRLRTLANTPVESPEIEFNGTRLFLIDISFESSSAVPPELEHRINLLGAGSPAHKPGATVPLSYTVAPIRIEPHVRKIDSPLSGNGWVDMNGCCEPGGVHRATGLPVNGRLYFAQRFAIDWMQLDSSGRMVNGDAGDVHNYTDYGADVLAVADGTVVETLNTLDDQRPGKLPDPKTITIENVDGNHIALDIGGGVYAFYAHLKKGSVKVSVGQHVKSGESLANLGNTGNTSAPHLHFHLMNGPSALGSSGIPYVLESFRLAGQLPLTTSDLDANFRSALFVKKILRQNQFPMDLAVIDFEAASR